MPVNYLKSSGNFINWKIQIGHTMIKFIGFKKDKIVVDMMRIISIEEVDTREVEIQLEGLSEPVLITKYTIEEVIKHINDNLGYEK